MTKCELHWRCWIPCMAPTIPFFFVFPEKFLTLKLHSSHSIACVAAQIYWTCMSLLFAKWCEINMLDFVVDGKRLWRREWADRSFHPKNSSRNVRRCLISLESSTQIQSWHILGIWDIYHHSPYKKMSARTVYIPQIFIISIWIKNRNVFKFRVKTYRGAANCKKDPIYKLLFV